MNAPTTKVITKIDYSTTPHPSGVVAHSLKNAPSLIEALLPVQKLSIDVAKEREARQSQTLTTLGSYWKGRKPLVLNKACILASLLPATDQPMKDLEVFELLMGMDSVSISKRLGLAYPERIVAQLTIGDIRQYFSTVPPGAIDRLPISAPFSIQDYPYIERGTSKVPRLVWRTDVSYDAKHSLAARLFEATAYRELSEDMSRAEEIEESITSHIWPTVNQHLGTKAKSVSELVEQLGVMRFGHRPTVADTFSGSGQIPFAAAKAGCDVYASDLNPVSGMLTWGAFNVVGAAPDVRKAQEVARKTMFDDVLAEMDSLGFESDGNGWRGKAYLYCVEITCPSSGWKVPILQTCVVSKGKSVVAKLIPDPAHKRYDIELKSDATAKELADSSNGTYINGAVVHVVDGVEHRNSITSIRGDYTEGERGARVKKNKLRWWEQSDIDFRPDDIFQERLYAIQWLYPDGSSRPQTEFRSVTQEDLAREDAVTAYVTRNLAEWQSNGWIPDTRIESGDETERLYRERGWTHWHHLFNPRQLLIAALIRKRLTAADCSAFTQVLNVNSRLSRWNYLSGPGQTAGVFDNQALNTNFNYGTRGVVFLENTLTPSYQNRPIDNDSQVQTEIRAAKDLEQFADIFISDPPYGDAVKYEEILEFFIAWLRTNPPKEFSSWIWDSRRELAVKGEDHDFKLAMVAAYGKMASKMPDNGLQVLMFTHQDINIWVDIANIVWASGLCVTAAWYVVTETDSALRDGANVKGTILLVLRKRTGSKRTNQSELAYELEDEVAEQIARLTGMNNTVAEDTARVKDGNLFEDSDLQMAGYAAALKVLTKYSIIDGKEMTQEALRPRVSGQTSLVESLIDFAVNTANKALVPQGLPESVWHDLAPAERFYLKMLEQESHGLNSLDNYQNFAKAFTVRNWTALMASERANSAALRSAKDFGRTEMNPTSELFETPTRGVLYALMDLQVGKDLDDVLKGLEQNLKVGAFYSARDSLVSIARFISKKVEGVRPDEASAARVLADGIENQRL
jgi:putative DNA methylase